MSKGGSARATREAGSISLYEVCSDIRRLTAAGLEFGTDGFDTADVTRYVSRSLLATKSDTVLVALAQGGSDVAFSAIVDRYGHSLSRCCSAFLPQHDAQDAVQQTFVRALVAFRSGSEIRDLRPWLHRIARNVALSELAARGTFHGDLSEEWEDFRQSGEVERRAELSAALAAIAQLPDYQRAALARSVSGESSVTIARELGVTGVAARQLLHRARVALRAAVQAVIPPPVLWLVRRLAAGAQRLPTPPPGIEPFVPKVAVAVAAATIVVAPASFIGTPVQHSGHPRPSVVASRPSMTAGDNAASIRSQPQRIASLAPTPGRHGAAAASKQRGVGVAGSSHAPTTRVPPARNPLRPAPARSVAATTPANLDGSAITTSDPNAGAPSPTDPTATDPSTTDASTSDPSSADSTGPTSADPSSTGTTTTDPTSTDPSGTATTSTDPTSTDPTSTDPTSTDAAPSSPTPP